MVHNSYRQRGGEDIVVDAEVALLRSYGSEVDVYRRHNDEVGRIGPISLAAQTIWSRRTTAEIRASINRFTPEVVHVHNAFPLISPSLNWAVHHAGVPIVQTLHNFRLLCPQAMLLRDEHPCLDCVGKLPWRGIVHRCYRNSAAQTSVLVGMLGVHRAMGTYQDKVTRYIALTNFSRVTFERGGVPAEKIRVKPNFVDLERGEERTRVGGLFVGRLSHEKGIAVLVGALGRYPAGAVTVVGDGPEAHRLRLCAGITPMGWRAWDDTIAQMRCSEYLIVPSLCFENFPLVIVEAFACGLPVIASRLGAMAELIQDGNTGLLFTPGSAEDLAATLQWADANREQMRQMGNNARAVYESKYTPAVNYAMVHAIYSEAIAEKARTLRPS